MLKHARPILMTVTITAALTPASAATIYSVTDLGDLPGGSDESTALGINAYGQVVGASDTMDGPAGSRAFLWMPTIPNGTLGSMIELGGNSAAAESTWAYSINARGQVVVNTNNGNGNRAFLWTPSTPNATTGSMIDLGNLGNSSTDGYTIGRGINDYGQVAGYSGAPFVGIRAFLWTPNSPNASTGSMIDLGDLPGGATTSFGYAINASGQVVGGTGAAPSGEHVFIWTPHGSNAASGTMHDLGDLPDRNDGQGLAINASGQVVGTSGYPVLAIPYHAFLWTPTVSNGSAGSMIDLGDLPGGAGYSYAQGINAAGEVVGFSGASGGERAFLWTSADGMADLNNLLDASGAGWTLESAFGINEFGQIVGRGWYDPDGSGGIAAVGHAFLLTPIPEPGGLALAAFAALIARRRHSGPPSR